MFLLVVLKVPVFFAIWLVWWGARSYDELGEELPGEGDHGFRRWRREPKRPRGPRRGGPHGGHAAVPERPPCIRRRQAGPAPPAAPALAGRRRRTHGPH